MSNIIELVDRLYSKSLDIVKIDKKYEKDIKKYNGMISEKSKIYMNINELDDIDKIKEFDIFDLKIDKEIEQLQSKINEKSNNKSKYSIIGSSVKKYERNLLKKMVVKDCCREIGKIMLDINNFFNAKKTEIYKSNSYKLESVENFIIRRFFVEYALYLCNELSGNEEETIKAFIYNVRNSIKDIKSDEDNWMLGKRFIENMKSCISKDIEYSKLTDSKRMIKAITELGDNEIYRRFILEMYNNVSLKKNIETNDDIIKICEKIDKLILDFIDVLSDSNIDLISYGFENIDLYKRIITKLGYEEIGLKELERLDTRYCETLESIDTDDIGKDFLISKVHRKGYKNSKKILRTTLVNVYRYSIVD